MKLVVMVMAVIEPNNNQHVMCSVGLASAEKGYKNLGSLNCTFEEFGVLNAILKQIPSVILDYRAKKWNDYIQKIMEELASL